MMKVLILGGTQRGRELASLLARDHACLLSFAGRTQKPQLPDVPCRVGGFGGVARMSAFLADFDALIDATHPFAARISEHAVHAAAIAKVPLLRVVQPAWAHEDNWTEVPDMHAAARATGAAPRRVFLTIGRLEVAAFQRAPQHTYLVRAIDTFDPGLPDAKVITARGPFTVDDERALLERERIEVLVSKNAGTEATYAKLAAARALGLPVVMVARPTLPAAHEVSSIEAALAWIHGRERGE